MDEVKDFFKELRDRVSSPFFGAFIISWLLFNWQVPLFLFYNNYDKLNKDRAASLIYNVLEVTNYCNSLLFPIMAAGAYTVLWPYIKREINVHIASQASKTEHDIIRKNKVNAVPLDKYVELLNETDVIQKKLIDIIEKQGTDHAALLALEVAYAEIENSAATTSAELEAVNKKNEITSNFEDPKNYYGTWVVERHHLTQIDEEIWDISESSIKCEGSVERLLFFSICAQTKSITMVYERHVGKTANIEYLVLQATDDPKRFKSVESISAAEEVTFIIRRL